MRNWLSKQVLGWLVPGGILLIAGTATAIHLLGQGTPGIQQVSSPDHGGKKTLGAGTGSPSGAVAFKTVQPQKKYFKKTIEHPAHVLPYEQADLFAKVSGYLDILHVDIGDEVKEGQKLAELWVPELVEERKQKEALVEQAKAEKAQAIAAQQEAEAMVKASQAKLKEVQKQLTKLQAEVDFHELELQRFQKLYEGNAIQKALVEERQKQCTAAQSGYEAGLAGVESAQANILVKKAHEEKAKADVQSADARQKVAEANLEHAKTMLAYTTIPAPFDGVITRRLYHKGAFIQSAASGKPEPLLTIVRVDKLRIVTDIPADDAVWVKVGQPAILKLKGIPDQLTGTVVRTAKALGTLKTLRTEIELKQFPKSVCPGMYGYVSIVVADQPDALFLPKSALVTGNKTTVMVMESGQPKSIEVGLGRVDGDRVQIVAGLTGQEQVIADPMQIKK